MSLLVNTLFATVKMVYAEREERKYRQKEGKVCEERKNGKASI